MKLNKLVIGVIVAAATVLSGGWPASLYETVDNSALDRSAGETALAASPTDKLNSALWYLMQVRQNPAARNAKGFKEALDVMDQRGGAVVSIWFDHILTDGEAAFLQRTYGVKFHEVGGKPLKAMLNQVRAAEPLSS